MILDTGTGRNGAQFFEGAVPLNPDKLLIYLAKNNNGRSINGYLPTVNLWLPWQIAIFRRPSVHGVMFATNRFAIKPVAGFHGRVAQHFAAVHSYGPGIELWSGAPLPLGTAWIFVSRPQSEFDNTSVVWGTRLRRLISQ